MVQKLSIKSQNADGTKTRKEVVVLRSWQDAGGAAIFYHKNGIYGYKDGAPVRTMGELSVMSGDAAAYRLAVQWWKTVGARISEEFYAVKDAELAEKALRSIGSAGGAGGGDNSNLDMAQYRRRPINDRRSAAYSEPSTWSAFFDQRPDWWGAASVIEIADYRYQLVDIDDAADKKPGDDDKKEPAGDAGGSGTTPPAGEDL